MAPPAGEPAWRMQENASWRAGYTYGARYPTMKFTFHGEALDAAGLAALSQGLLAILPPAPAMTSRRTLELAPVSAIGIAGAADLLVRAMNQIQRAAGMPVHDLGWALSSSGNEATILVPTLAGSYQVIANTMNWLVQACGLLRAGVHLAEHQKLLTPHYQQLRQGYEFHSVAHQFIIAALNRGTPFVELPTQAIQFGQGHLVRRMRSSITDVTSSLSLVFGRIKQTAAIMLGFAGIPVPEHHTVADREAAVKAADTLGYPVVVKPADLDGGVAVNADLRTADEVRQAYDIAVASSASIIVEKHVPGRDYRITVYRDKVIWTIERVPGGVTGDGQSTIGQLIAQVNANPERQEGRHSALKPLLLDEEAQLLLAREGMTEQSIPAAGQFVRFRRAANIAGGGMPVAVNEHLHPDNGQLAIRAAAAIGADIAGVDLLIPDIAVSWLESGAYICDINPGPDLGQTTAAHLYEPILASLVEGTGRIPIVLVAGAEAGSPLEHLTAQQLGLDDMTIGWHDARGLFAGSEKLARDPGQAFFAGRTLVNDRRIEAIVMQINSDDLVTTSLPFPWFDLLVLAGQNFTSMDPANGRSSEAVFADLLPTLLPACDGEILVLPKAMEIAEDLRATTGAVWRTGIAEEETAAILGTEIRRIAAAHRAPLPQQHNIP